MDDLFRELLSLIAAECRRAGMLPAPPPPPPDHGTSGAVWRHRKHREPMCELCRLYYNAHRPSRATSAPRKPRTRRATGECWCCGRTAELHGSGKGKGLCRNCAARWCARRWAGPGPGPARGPRLERALDARDIITTLSAAAAAERLGCSARTIQRWRTALRDAA